MKLTEREMLIAVAAFTAGMENAGCEDRNYAEIVKLVSQMTESGYLERLVGRFKVFWNEQN